MRNSVTKKLHTCSSYVVTQGMAYVYKSICNEVDLLCMLITHLVEKEIAYKIEIEKLMNKGFVQIAKARYIMGSTCVTKMQLPTENSNPIQAVATVCRAQVNNCWIFHIHRKDIFSTFQVKKDQLMGDNHESEFSKTKNVNNFERDSLYTPEVTFKNILQSDPKSLKKTKTAFCIDDTMYKDYNEELLDEMSTDSDSSSSLCSVVDPIRLFGILVPNTLKEAQVIFKDVLNLLGKCATLQSELKEIFHKYNHMKKVKELIEAAAEEMKIDILKPKIYWCSSESSPISSQSTFKFSEEHKDKDNLNQYSVQKTIKSVFYDLKEIESQETELSIWSNKSTKYDSEGKSAGGPSI